LKSIFITMHLFLISVLYLYRTEIKKDSALLYKEFEKSFEGGLKSEWRYVENQIRNNVGKNYPGRLDQKRNVSGYLKMSSDNTISTGSWKVKDLSGLTNFGLLELASFGSISKLT
jgi:hypothetical protein